MSMEGERKAGVSRILLVCVRRLMNGARRTHSRLQRLCERLSVEARMQARSTCVRNFQWPILVGLLFARA